MDRPTSQPRFGTADLSNCERELIHLAGSIQPHGVLLVLREPDLVVLQATTNVADHFGAGVEEIQGLPVARLDPGLAEALAPATRWRLGDVRRPVRFRRGGTPGGRRYLGLVHRHPSQGLRVELEPRDPPGGPDEPAAILETSGALLDRIREASAVEEVTGEMVRSLRALTGYDRVMVYRFDRAGHGEVVAESREEGLEPYLGLRYPASDIPQRARRLYLRNRLRVLVDVDYDPVPVVPRAFPETGEDLDMSLCYLRSMSPIHLQYLRNMGVTATLVTSLVVDGELWGLVACHHYAPKNLSYEHRAASQLATEVASARIGVLETRARAEAEIRVRGLERRIIRCTSREGDWRGALLEDPDALLDPLDATGAALFYDGRVDTVGRTPPGEDLRRIRRAVADAAEDRIYETDAVELDLPGIGDVGPDLAGLLAVELSASAGEYLIWFRPEQIQTVRWAGDPRKPVVTGDDPEDLSPRRSFAVWTELVRDRSRPWEDRHLELAGILGNSLRDVIGQVRAMRLLLAEREIRRLRDQLRDTSAPLLVTAGDGRVLFRNTAFSDLCAGDRGPVETLEDLPALFVESLRVRALLEDLRARGRPFQDELRLVGEGGREIPVAVRVDAIPAGSGRPLGHVVVVTDLRKHKRREDARRHLERVVEGSVGGDGEPAGDGEGARGTAGEFHERVASALLSMAPAAGSTVPDPGALEDIEVSARRARELSRILLDFTGVDEGGD